MVSKLLLYHSFILIKNAFFTYFTITHNVSNNLDFNFYDPLKIVRDQTNKTEKEQG